MGVIIKYIPLQQGLRLAVVILPPLNETAIIKYIPLQQGLRPVALFTELMNQLLLSIFHYNKD